LLSWKVLFFDNISGGHFLKLFDKLGLLRHWPKDGICLQFDKLDLLRTVLAILKKYERWAI